MESNHLYFLCRKLGFSCSARLPQNLLSQCIVSANILWKGFEVCIYKVHVGAAHVSSTPNAVLAHIDLASRVCDLIHLLHEGTVGTLAI